MAGRLGLNGFELNGYQLLVRQHQAYATLPMPAMKHKDAFAKLNGPVSSSDYHNHILNSA